MEQTWDGPVGAGLGRGRVLLMDDEDLVRHTAGILLEELGYDVECAPDGADAIARYRAALGAGARFDAVILDLTVRRGMGGHEALVELLRLDPAVRAVLSTGHASHPLIAESRRHGLAGVIEKPYTMDEMGAVLRHVIG